MKALVKSKKAEGIWMVHDAPVPEVGVHDVRIRVRKSAICGTDVHIYNWDAWSQRTIPVPMIVGHEYVGVVDAVGAEVEAFSPATASPARATSPAASAGTAEPAAATSAATPWGSG